MKFAFSSGSTIERDKSRRTNEYRCKSKIEDAEALINHASNGNGRNHIKNKPYDQSQDNYNTKPRYHR